MDEFLLMRINKETEIKVKDIYLETINKIEKKDLVKLEVDGVHIGDLIYDSFLRQNEVPTINIKDKKFCLFEASLNAFCIGRIFLKIIKSKP